MTTGLVITITMSAAIKKLLMNERWRPRTMDEMVLPDRIRDTLSGGVNANYIFHGHFGTGKTTLARILIGKWTRDRAHLELNSSFHTSIDTLRTKIDEFCSSVYMGLDLDGESPMHPTKYVFLDEFERTSAQYQDALKAYIEEYSSKGVRFILNTNHVERVTDGIRSRMTHVCFDPQDAAEERKLKIAMYRRISEIIAPAEGIDISKDGLIRIINSSFPDFRSMLNSLQLYAKTGELPTPGSLLESNRKELYEMLDNSPDGERVYDFVTSKFGQDNIHALIKMLGSEYTQWLISSGRRSGLFEVNSLVANAYVQMQHCLDPVVVAVALIGSISKVPR